MSKRFSFNIKNKIYDVLNANKDRRMTARQIAQQILIMFPEDCDAKKQRARVDFKKYTFEDQLVSEIGANWRKVVNHFDDMQTVEKRPREFYVSSESEEAEADKAVVPSHSSVPKPITEHDLYPKLGEYVWSEFNCYAMRVDERKSQNARGPKGNMWLYPDIVGMQSLTSNWSKGTADLAKASKAELAHLFSFEVKLVINRSNVREVFFQTLSNSAWAHYSFLAAADINSKAMPELRLLCASHGIGLIQIEADDPSNSQTLIPARQKDAVDWNLLDRLAVENKDAKAFVKAVRDFHLTDETSRRYWDLCPKDT